MSNIKLTLGTLIDAFGLQNTFTFQGSYNVAPTRLIPAIREQDQQRTIDSLRWGLIPHWAKDKSIGNRMINARMETVEDKPSFKKPLKHQRCIIPADGFYEWRREGKSKQPFYIHRADNEPLTFAGLWEHWVDKETGEIVDSCTVITTAASLMMREIHDRMPVVMDYERAKEWLNAENVDPGRLTDILAHPGAVELDMYPVSDYVNNVKNDDENCVERVDV